MKGYKETRIVMLTHGHLYEKIHKEGQNKHFPQNHVSNSSGKVPFSGAGLNSFLLPTPLYFPKLVSEKYLILILLTYSFKRVYHIQAIIAS